MGNLKFQLLLKWPYLIPYSQLHKCVVTFLLLTSTPLTHFRLSSTSTMFNNPIKLRPPSQTHSTTIAEIMWPNCKLGVLCCSQTYSKISMMFFKLFQKKYYNIALTYVLVPQQ